MRGRLTCIAAILMTTGTAGMAAADDAAPAPKPPKPPDPDAPKKWEPVRWMSPEGTTVTFSIAAKRAELPKLEITHGEAAYQVAMPGAFKEMSPAFVAFDDGVMITTASTPGAAWRYTWKKGRMVVAKRAAWKTEGKRAAWAVDANPSVPDAALRRIASLLRLTGTAPGLDQYFTAAPAAWNVYTRGDKQPWKRTMPGKEVLQKWFELGYPILRGKVLIANGCLSLPANADGKPAAAAAPPEAPHLQRICVDAKLAVTAVDTLVAPEPGKTRPPPTPTP